MSAGRIPRVPEQSLRYVRFRATTMLGRSLFGAGPLAALTVIIGARAAASFTFMCPYSIVHEARDVAGGRPAPPPWGARDLRRRAWPA